MNKKEKQQLLNKRYRENNPEKIKQIQADYYHSHRKERIENARKWTINNKEKASQTRQVYMKTPKGRLSSIKSSAKTRGIDYGLEESFALEILTNKCYYCLGDESIGIDRLDSTIGYTKENVEPCCSLCNYMKNIFSKEKFIEQCKKISAIHS